MPVFKIISNATIPKRSYCKILLYTLSGKSENRNFAPSSGGMGIKLNMPSPTLMLANINRKLSIYDTITFSNGDNAARKNSATKASIRFETGPASAVMAIPCLGFLKFLMLTGTGFAQPNPATISMISPKISICFNGFNDSRPSPFAVESPSL